MSQFRRLIKTNLFSPFPWQIAPEFHLFIVIYEITRSCLQITPYLWKMWRHVWREEGQRGRRDELFIKRFVLFRLLVWKSLVAGTKSRQKKETMSWINLWFMMEWQGSSACGVEELCGASLGTGLSYYYHFNQKKFICINVTAFKQMKTDPTSTASRALREGDEPPLRNVLEGWLKQLAKQVHGNCVNLNWQIVSLASEGRESWSNGENCVLSCSVTSICRVLRECVIVLWFAVTRTNCEIFIIECSFLRNSLPFFLNSDVWWSIWPTVLWLILQIDFRQIYI